MTITDAVLTDAARAFDLDTSQLSKLNDGADCVLYEFSRLGAPCLLRISEVSQSGLGPVTDRQAFVSYLAANGVSVPAMYPSAQGRTLEVLEVEGKLWTAVCMQKLAGRHPNLSDPNEWNVAYFRRWGRLIGQLHRLAKGFSGGSLVMSWEAEVAFMRETCGDDEVRRKWDEMRAVLEGLPQDPDCFGLTHNDLHCWNLMDDGDALWVLDFDVAAHHWFATDLGCARFLIGEVGSPDPAVSRSDFVQAATDSLLAGYAEENQLSSEWLERLPLFTSYRRLLMFSVSAGGPNELGRWRQAILSDKSAS